MTMPPGWPEGHDFVAAWQARMAVVQQQQEDSRDTRTRYSRKLRLVKAMREAYRALDWHAAVSLTHEREMELFADALLNLLDEEGESMLPRGRP